MWSGRSCSQNFSVSRADDVVGTFRCAPLLAEIVELADIGGLLPARPGRADAFQVGRQAMGVADERDALAALGKPTGLLHGEEGLAAARSAAHLDTIEQPDGVKDDRLVFGQSIGGVFVGECAGHNAALR